MKTNNRRGIIHYALLSVVLRLCYCGSNGVGSQLKIYRDTHDIFTNLQCSIDGSKKCTPEQCNTYDADCFDGNNCTYCRCLEGRDTFVTENKDGRGKCKSDLEIIPESG